MLLIFWIPLQIFQSTILIRTYFYNTPNMFLLWLSCSFVFEKRDTEGCKSKSQK